MTATRQTETNKIMSFLKSRSHYFVIAVFIFLVYVNALPNDFVWDDDILVVENHLIKSVRNLPAFFSRSFFELEAAGSSGGSYYRPFILVSLAVDYSIWGLRPFGYHLTNILIHMLNVLLFYHFFTGLSRDKRAGLLAGLCYGVNPVHTTPVSFIGGRTDLFASFFFLISLVLYRRFRGSTGAGMFRCFLGSLFFFCLSLLCKESIIVLPLIVVLYDICFTDRFKRDIFQRKSLLIYMPFAVIWLGYFVVRWLVIPEQNFDFMIHSFSDLMSRAATIVVMVVSYWKLLLFPVHLSTERSIELITSLASPAFFFGLLVLSIVLALTLRWWFSDRKLFFCSMWFFIIFLPVSNIIPVFPSLASSHLYFAEQLMYLPSMGFFFVIAALFLKTADRFDIFSGACWKRTVSLIAIVALLFEFSILTIRRNTDWRNSLRFYTSSLKANPSSVRIMNNLGIHYLKIKQYHRALPLFEAILAIQPNSTSAYNNIATIYEDHTLVQKAETMYRKALSFNERDIRARLGLGRILARSGRVEEAKKQFSLLAAWHPTLSVAHHELGRMLMAQEKYQEALRSFEHALSGSPSPDVVLNSIGILYVRQNELERASEYFKQALDVNPASYQAHVNLGNIYFEQKLFKEAAAEYEEALSSGINLPAIERRLREIRAIQSEEDTS